MDLKDQVVSVLTSLSDQYRRRRNTYRARSFNTAAIGIMNHQGPLPQGNAILNIRGIGPVIARYIQEFVTTGRIRCLEEPQQPSQTTNQEPRDFSPVSTEVDEPKPVRLIPDPASLISTGGFFPPGLVADDWPGPDQLPPPPMVKVEPAKDSPTSPVESPTSPVESEARNGLILVLAPKPTEEVDSKVP